MLRHGTLFCSREHSPLLKAAAENRLANASRVDLGHTVVEADCGETGWELFQTQSIDVLFTDLGLPGMSGAELGTMVRERRPEIVIVVATGNADAPPFPGSGPTYLLRKPFDLIAVSNVLSGLALSPTFFV